MAKITEMTMGEITNRALELGFPRRRAKGEQFFHWNYSQEQKAVEFLKKKAPELFEENDDNFPDDAA